MNREKNLPNQGRFISRFSNDFGPLYSYATLNKHPLNSLKVLGILKDETIHPWINSPE
jgi:hypothetical protein